MEVYFKRDEFTDEEELCRLIQKVILPAQYRNVRVKDLKKSSSLPALRDCERDHTT
jgi:hypothetical protein